MTIFPVALNSNFIIPKKIEIKMTRVLVVTKVLTLSFYFSRVQNLVNEIQFPSQGMNKKNKIKKEGG